MMNFFRHLIYFNLPMNAEMVVLSACETGTGKIVKGEGVMSLARGFSYTGCPSVLMSLWSVSDKASADIMIRFYEHLEQGNAKDQSLRKAKLDFIKNRKSIHHHPYYWAAFVPIGDSGVIAFDNSISNWIWYGGAVVLMIFLYFFLKIDNSFFDTELRLRSAEHSHRFIHGFSQRVNFLKK